MPIPSPTDRFRRQHAELGQLANRLIAQLADKHELEQDAGAIRRSLATLAGKLKVHAAMEDEALYPRLLVHSNLQLRDLSVRIRQEFGDVYGSFVQYLDTWTVDAIQARPDEFIETTKRVMKALGTRMKVENETLYAMVDRVEGSR